VRSRKTEISACFRAIFPAFPASRRPATGAFAGRRSPPGFGNVGIAAAARTGHNVTWHDIASGSSDRPGFRARREVWILMNEPVMKQPVVN